jgi:hypothetical protein
LLLDAASRETVKHKQQWLIKQLNVLADQNEKLMFNPALPTHRELLHSNHLYQFRLIKKIERLEELLIQSGENK